MVHLGCRAAYVIVYVIYVVEVVCKKVVQARSTKP